MQASGDDPPLLHQPFDFISGLRFIPKDFFSLLVCTSTDKSTGLPPEQACGDDPPALLDRFFDFLDCPRFTPKDFFPLLVCTSADESTGLLPEQGLFPFANHTISDVGRFMKNLKDLPACDHDPHYWINF
eukprot:scaffold79572_cov67-Attheya_sp.AAC.2